MAFLEKRQWTLFRSNDIDFQHIFGKLNIYSGTYEAKVDNSGTGNYTLKD